LRRHLFAQAGRLHPHDLSFTRGYDKKEAEGLM
jgi:hypothetical protein